MKLSKQTLRMLMNFREINKNLFIPKGNTILTGGSLKELLSRIVVNEEFEKEISIYDLGQFLSSISTFNEPEIHFQDKFLDIKEGPYTQRFRYASKEIVQSAKKFIEFSDDMYNFKFPLTSTDIKRIQKSSASNKSPDIVIENGHLVVGEVDPSTDTWNPVANKFIIEIPELSKSNPECFIILPAMNFKVLPLDYDVGVCFSSNSDGRKILHFKSVDPEYNIEYILNLSFESWIKG